MGLAYFGSAVADADADADTPNHCTTSMHRCMRKQKNKQHAKAVAKQALIDIIADKL